MSNIMSGKELSLTIEEEIKGIQIGKVEINISKKSQGI